MAFAVLNVTTPSPMEHHHFFPSRYEAIPMLAYDCSNGKQREESSEMIFKPSGEK